MKKALMYLLLIVLLMSLVPFASFAEAGPAKLTDEPVTLTVFRQMDANLQDYITSWNEAPFYQKLEELTGVHIEFINPTPSAAAETFNSLVISGELPDIIFNSNLLYSGGSYQAVLDGYYVDLSDYLPNIAPEYWNLITSSDEIWRETVDEGNTISAFYRIFSEANPAASRLILKKELINQLGVDTVPVTLGDWEALFDKMLNAGITPYMLNADGYEEKLLGAFDVMRNFYIKDGKVAYGQIQDEFRQYLAKMHEWYDKGYISKDFISASNADTLFAMNELGTYAKPIVAAYNFGIKEGYTVLSTPYPRQSADQVLHWDPYGNALVWKGEWATANASVSTSCKNIDLTIKWLNFYYTEAGRELVNWGVEGLNYEVVDGEHRYLPIMWDYKGISGEGLNYYFKFHNGPTYALPDTTCHANLLKSPEAAAIRFQYCDDPLIDSVLFLPEISLNAEEADTRTSVMTDVDTYVNEMVIRFIVGAESLDNWDTYVKNVEDMKIADAVAAMQSAYDRYMSVKLAD